MLLENVSGLRRKLRKKLENGTRHTRVQMSNLWLEKRAGEENAGTHEEESAEIEPNDIVLTI